MNPPKSRKPPSPSSRPAADALASSSQLEIGGKSVRIVRIDNLQPHEVGAAKNGRPRITYAPGEIAHFDFEGHRYALVSDAPASPANVTMSPDVQVPLTNRELQICHLICMGYLTKQVAARLKLSEFTVRSYLKTVYCKLSVRSRGAMVYRFTQAFQQATEQARQSVPSEDVEPEA